MRILRSGIVLAALAMAALGNVQPTMAEDAAINLTYEPGGAANVWFASKTGKPHAVMKLEGKEGTVKLFGSDVAAAINVSATGKATLALDCHAAGKLAPADYKPMTKENTASFDIDVPVGNGKRKTGVLLSNIRWAMTKANAVAVASAVVFPTGCWKCSINSVPVRIIDENLDGKIALDGTDSIQIGASNFAIPLYATHEIGGTNYELKVSEDGAKITATAVKDLELGVVETPFKSNLSALMLVDAKNGRAYDVKVSGAKGIPAGDYQLAYGVVEGGKKDVTFAAGREGLTYSITAGKINRLRIGDPIKVDFSGTFAAATSTVNVFPMVSVVGAGGELYDFQHAGGMGLPTVAAYEGTRRLSSENMSFG